jgi:hypothetical protein
LNARVFTCTSQQFSSTLRKLNPEFSQFRFHRCLFPLASSPACAARRSPLIENLGFSISVNLLSGEASNCTLLMPEAMNIKKPL